MAERLRQIPLNRSELARESGVALNTVRDLLDGRAWPMNRTAAAIERVIGWPEGSINAIANGGAVPEVESSYDSRSGIPDAADAGATVSDTQGPDAITVSLAPGVLDGLDQLAIAQVEAEARVAALRFLRELQETRARREEAAP